MRLVLTLPGLVAADPPPASPALARLLAAAGPPVPEPRGLAAALAAEYGVTAPAGSDVPLAPLLAAAAGAPVDDAYWLLADPVTLVAGRDDVLLAGRVDDLSVDETAALLVTLNAHFSADGIAFVAPAPSAWFVRMAATPALLAPAPDTAAGRPLRDLLPRGADAPRWRRWQHEVQMLLHAHPVTQARAAAGRAAATSVWFWGGGRAADAKPAGAVAAVAMTGGAVPAGTGPRPGATAIDARGGAGGIVTWGGDRVAVALAQATGTPARALPREPAGVLAVDVPVQVVVLPAGTADAALADAFASSAWTALLRGRVSEVTVIADGAGVAWRWSARRPGFAARVAARAAWRGPPLAPLLAAARDA